MNVPRFTTDPVRIARLRENYEAGVAREKITSDIRCDMDMKVLQVDQEKLEFLFQNVMESYPKQVKNLKVNEYNQTHGLY